MPNEVDPKIKVAQEDLETNNQDLRNLHFMAQLLLTHW